ncbi:MAG: glycosyltransferase family 4 protein [Cyanobacteria bacterium P01_F01_bin.86]
MESTTKKRVAVWQPYFLGGGAEAVALWILEALYSDYEVTLYTLSSIDLSWLDAMYSTQLADKPITVKTQLPKWLNQPADFLISNNKMLRMSLIYWTIRYFKSVASQYDVVFSAFNSLDMGQSGIQYLHWIHVIENDREDAKPWFKILMKWVDFSYESLRSNLSIANSQYTANRVEETYGIKADVVFPPVITQIEALPWQEKENAFLCSGRIVPAKQTHRVIEILKMIRDKGFDIKLHITGGGGGSYGQDYLRQVEALAQEYSDWVYLHQNLPYVDYLKILARCRFGIHYKPEPFGISIAEMLKAGMIPFVRSKGGQMEIVGADHGDILFDNDTDAVEKIVKVLSDQSLQDNLLRSLEERQEIFSTGRFVDEIRAVVKKYLATSEKEASCATF